MPQLRRSIASFRSGLTARRWQGVAAVAGLVSVALLGQGCGPDPAYGEGRKAEKLGEPHVAYGDYLQAARKSPGDGGVAAGIKRTAPAAAAHWQAEAWKAMSEKRYGDTWRNLMRILEIRPNDTTTANLILQLQKLHPTEIAEARADWLRRGSASLALGTPKPAPEKPVATQPAHQAEAVVLAEPAAMNPHPLPMALDTESLRPPDPDNPTMGGLLQITPRTPPSNPGRKGTSKHPQPPARQAAKNMSELDPRSSEEGTSLIQSASAEAALKPEPPQISQDFLVLRTLSKKDHRFSPQALLIDGIAVKLKGTDDEPEADLDLFDGKKRVKKIRGMRIGASQTFPGHSGINYRLVVLAIHDKTQTVRIGVQERPDPSKLP